MIYLKLSGRIGNQLFMYATARMIQLLKGDVEEIVIEDTNNISPEGISYENSLVYYSLPNVRYVHDKTIWNSARMISKKLFRKLVFEVLEGYEDQNKMHDKAMKYQALYNMHGYFHLWDGYTPYPKRFKKDTLVEGYFQSEKYFEPIADEIRRCFRLEEVLESSNYPNLQKIKEGNTVCISAKVQHNVGNKMFDVCNDGYFKAAIEYITNHVDNPLFFICSDDVDYVKKNLIDVGTYDYVVQDLSYPAHISLAAMAQSKHFVIGNTSFGWWAQYLSDNPNKIVVAPSRWYNGMDNWQYDIYQDNWTRIEV